MAPTVVGARSKREGRTAYASRRSGQGRRPWTRAGGRGWARRAARESGPSSRPLPLRAGQRTKGCPARGTSCATHGRGQPPRNARQGLAAARRTAQHLPIIEFRCACQHGHRRARRPALAGAGRPARGWRGPRRDTNGSVTSFQPIPAGRCHRTDREAAGPPLRAKSVSELGRTTKARPDPVRGERRSSEGKAGLLMLSPNRPSHPHQTQRDAPIHVVSCRHGVSWRHRRPPVGAAHLTTALAMTRPRLVPSLPPHVQP